MAYDLYLRRPGTASLDEGALQKRIAEVGGRLEASRYALGLTQIRLTVQRDDKGLLGYDVEVPFGSPEKEFREGFSVAVALADFGPMTIFDPQLGKSVSKASADEVVESWRRASSWQVDVAGLREDARGIAPVAPIKPLIEPKTGRLLIIVGGVLLFFWLASRALTSFWLNR
jgi:hypothetical protein